MDRVNPATLPRLDAKKLEGYRLNLASLIAARDAELATAKAADAWRDLVIFGGHGGMGAERRAASCREAAEEYASDAEELAAEAADYIRPYYGPLADVFEAVLSFYSEAAPALIDACAALAKAIRANDEGVGA